MAYSPYEQGGIVGPNQKALLGQLAGGTAAPAPPAAAGNVGPTLPYTPPAPGDLSEFGRENHASLGGAAGGAASMASTGASIGSVIPGLGTLAGAGIGAGVGAIGGLLKGRTNDTKNAREQFAQSQGLPNSTALWQKLQDSASPDAASELQNRALNRIGKHDTTANDQWMQDVQAALSAGKPAAAPAAAPAAVTDAAPTALQIPQGASGPEAAKYLMSQGMKGQELTDYLKAQGYQDNGLYYPDSGMYGFSDAYMGPDGNIVTRTPESSQGGSSVMQAPTAGLDSKLGGDPMAAIQQALQQYSGGANIQALLKQLGA